MEPRFCPDRSCFMPRHIIALTLALVVPATAALGQDDPVLASRAAYQAAVRAYEAHDVPAFLRNAREAQRLRPTHGGVLYALASACAMAGDTAAALRALRRFALLGYTADVVADSDLARLRGTPAFDSVRAALDRNAAPLIRGRLAFTLPERDLLTEGIAYDPRSRAFFVGSVRHRKILRVDRGGRVTEFVHPGADLPWAPLGMRVDPARGVLWVATAAVPQSLGFDPGDSLRSGLVRFDVATGVLKGRYPVPDDGRPHALGDVTVTRAGDLYATDSRSPVIYRVRAGSDSLERFVSSPLLLSGQGLALDAAERVLYVADYARGILRVDLATREVRLLDSPDDAVALGIDGLYFDRGDLVGIQNGVAPHRVVRLRLSEGGDRIAAIDVLERARPEYAEPTLGVVMDGELYYVANSQWERFREDGGIEASDRLRPPLVLRLRL
jgi:sugar lactone lactonase YvrE